MIVIEGIPVQSKDMYRYTISFVLSDSGYEPVLYEDGRRVVKAWRANLSLERARDEYGPNANTAG
jgi:hypothetical protein